VRMADEKARTKNRGVAEHRHLDVLVEQALLDRARERAVSIFPVWHWMPPGGTQYLSRELKGENPVLDVARDVVPSLAFAERHFGDPLPDALVKKLQNKSQTEDTLFELLCLGLLSARHKVVYEPQIGSGKVPDLLIEPVDGPPVYVECKSHHMLETKYWQAFQSISSRVCQTLGDEPLVKAAWADGLRTEVYLKGRPSDGEITSLKSALASLHLQTLKTGSNLSSKAGIKAVPRTQRILPGVSLHGGVITVGTEWTEVSHATMQIAVHCWPKLGKQRRATQRALLREARLKLREIPEGAVGMICIQTVSSSDFLPEIHELIDQAQFSRIPIIWLNPSLRSGSNSKIVFRDEARQLVDRLFC